ncbi:DNA ligase D [Candidatus Manganitrophus noduliformans]|uniref:DNA ligase (ATP) n=1 Tax=Candidatus Manganitrophus noduliformans TaxID=2606439 RepID=A0A7X6DRM9_9BACT|nr:DNA ligase D [Candidatus Manganitrophus noduliformans]NKE72090.1 DNA ligase D [Candidatus Manganitrophus noduliformans]
MKKNPLSVYQQKRNFNKTPEPSGVRIPPRPFSIGNRFSIQEHHARRLHYDLRLEMDGVLKSWAIPKGLPASEEERRLAVRTEDHPLDYLDFEGVIPEGNYGAGEVFLWEIGTYQVVSGDLEKGKLTFVVSGRRHHGRYTLVRTDRKGEKEAWLIMKSGSSLPEGNDPIPSPFAPMRAALGEKPFVDPDWVFEEKWDGVRALVRLVREGESVRIDLWGRNLSRFDSQYPEVVEQLCQLMEANRSIRSLILDGEVVALDEKGKPSFQLLQHRMHLTDSEEIGVVRKDVPATYLLFDLLYMNGKSLMTAPLIYRRELLASLSLPHGTLRLSPLYEDGIALFERLRAEGGEGIVAKRKDSVYSPGRRSREWIKLKLVQELDCVVAGWTEGRGNRSHTIGALLLGLYEGEALHYISHTGSGFDAEMLRQVEKELRPLEIDQCPFSTRPKTNARAHWVTPRLVARVKFTHWTQDRHLRAPILLGLRDDIAPKECRFEPRVNPEEVVPQKKEKKEIWIGERVAVQFEGNRLELGHLNKQFWPKRGYTKAHLIDYYSKVAPFVLPHLQDRPLTLIRFPEGIEGESFYQKDWKEAAPHWVHRVTIETEEETHRRMIVCNNASTLVWLANLGNIELHPSYSRVDPEGSLAPPDFIVFDIDPPKREGKEGVDWKRFEQGAEVALWLNRQLGELGIQSHVKTTGKSGLHVFVPIIPIYSYTQTRRFARAMAEQLQAEHPKQITTAWQKEQRGKKVLIDFNQNAAGKTLASIYSLRAVPEATVSFPIKWEALRRVSPLDYTMESVPDLLTKSGDLWEGILKSAQDPMEALKKLQ